MIISVLLLLITSCSSVKNEREINEERKWSKLLLEYKNLDSLLFEHSFSEFNMNYYSDDTVGVVKLTLFLDKDKSVAIKYPSFDVTGNLIGYSVFFLDENDKPFALYRVINSVNEITLFDIKEGSFYRDTLGQEINYEVSLGKAFRDLNYQCEVVKNFDNLMYRFSSLGKYSPTECLNNLADIVVNVDSVSLYRDRSGNKKNIIKYLPVGSRLKYIVVDSSTVYYMNEYTHFLKVGVIGSSDTGWVCYVLDDFIDVNELTP